MAYRRSICSRASLLKQRFHPSCSYIIQEDHEKSQPSSNSSRPFINNVLERGSFKSYPTSKGFAGYGALFQSRVCTSFYPPFALGSSFCNYSSDTISEGSDKMEYISEVADILSEKGTEVAASHSHVASEVAVAAADSVLPVAILQYVIDGIHSFTGLNWWASIALTTFMIRGATIPLLINQLKASSKLAVMRPKLEEIKKRMQDNEMDPSAVSEGQKQMKAIFNEYGVTPFTPLKGVFIQGPVFICFFLAISNMVEKVPSFKTGGAYWFTDLTTPDSLYIFPVLTSLTFLITVEANLQEGMEGNPVASTMKNFSRVLAVLTVPFTMSFPKAIFFYWITSNLFSLMYGLVIKRPQVKKYLNLPEFPVMPATSSPPPAFSLFTKLKESVQATTKEPSPSPPEPAKIADRRIPSSSVISQRLRSLEKQVKGRKKNRRT
ncbi:hypothetical protein Scep_025620 [Stephania cephalantha]|uniref:Membrane insertase YidC/Oxa/ALB C-terminal domain-containing protein n=1 Tax=Stephania cephalantha TaxID=152367 RepID=A0AAP0EIK7_9MAGN